MSTSKYFRHPGPVYGGEPKPSPATQIVRTVFFNPPEGDYCPIRRLNVHTRNISRDDRVPRVEAEYGAFLPLYADDYERLGVRAEPPKSTWWDLQTPAEGERWFNAEIVAASNNKWSRQNVDYNWGPPRFTKLVVKLAIDFRAWQSGVLSTPAQLDLSKRLRA